MKKYTVDVTRTTVDKKTLTVSAETPADAMALAKSKAESAKGFKTKDVSLVPENATEVK